MSDARRRPPSSTDVAALAGVSQKTVSRVLNGEPYVTDEVRERVLAAARELGYRRNTAARALHLGRFHRIGVASIGSSLYGPSSLLVALERQARQIGYAFAVAYAGEGAGVTNAVESLLAQGVDALVVSDPIDPIDGGQELRIDPDVPVLSFRPIPGLAGPRVVVTGASGVEAGRQATEHLLGLGHATVWHVAGPHRWPAARDRARGWREALAAAGAAEPPAQEGDWSPASGYAAGQVLAADPRVTAVFVANDDMAIGVLRALAEAGRAVPEEVSVVGMDDIPAAAYLSPPLTTIRQDFEAIARHGLALLAAEIERSPSEHSDPAEPAEPAEPREPAEAGEPREPAGLPPHLVVRRSTAPPAKP
ncbi:LacI family DNA-binding transcriptional regulator [Nonomuraea jabiensis]|uniref:DNA-binding LacI/PurR family transcriptional regulator n=1 Tax=Nonomuraea jabiensis TaxID=882448 RepID=A0A7W9GEI7_9ACTN|nr:LacI family DNA-binding transcriptional regulator [Nonomuraea jabiensis]MBB5782374.1 DNA-binding LacI/PurR family transcriptional regulator [Nonomuraea jabiensis]